MKTLLTTAALVLLAAACNSEDPKAAAPDGNGQPAAGEPVAQTVAIPAATREVRCGCKVEAIGKCGNYVAVDGEWLEIVNPQDHGLGKMEWCSASEAVEATVAGEREAGGIAVSQLDVQ